MSLITIAAANVLVLITAPASCGLSLSQRGCEPPAMAFRIACTVLALSVRLVNGIAVDARSGGNHSLEMLVDIINVYNEAGACRAQLAGRSDFMLGRNTMQPDGCSSGENFRVYGPTLVVAVDTAGFKPEGSYEKIVCCFEIFVNEERNNTANLSH
jgi:hypothetical protein